MKLSHFILACFLIFYPIILQVSAQNNSKSYDPELNSFVIKNTEKQSVRTIRYTPDGEDFVITNGKNKFNRALYGSNTGFRVETGDVPEFALYLPRMGGNLSFQIGNKTKKISLNSTKIIESRYRAGSRSYTIEDALLGKGKLKISVLATYDREGMILKFETFGIPCNTDLGFTFGGCADKRFSREGDWGVDPPDCFDLKPEYCKGNEFTINKNTFQVIFGAKKDKMIKGVFPDKTKMGITGQPVLKGKIKLKKNETFYLFIYVDNKEETPVYKTLENIFNQANQQRLDIASQLKISTPDPWLNTLGATLSVAADGIWSGDTWLHGAVGWRMPLGGWRAAYVGDVMGWHDRATSHFSAYAASQVKDVPPLYPHPAQDTALNLARSEKKWGTQMYSNGYICRNPNRNDQMHHYDMNLCYIDELLWHFSWTGDTVFLRKMWPVITSSLVWEKRNFDPDNDGLYDAYCCIWASDALYYNSGGVTHSSAYNYRANKMADKIATILGENSEPYRKEADKIKNAINKQLWLPRKGHWAEFKDLMGRRNIHENAAVWTIYHAIDSELDDPFQNFQATRYIDTEIPHIPIEADGLEKNKYYTLSTTNWTPYAWSINNVAFAEVYHTILAYFEAGRFNEACRLLKSEIIDGMYLGASPGNIGQISYYDAARGECYRDFGDPIGVLSRVIVQGLYGINPDLLNERIYLRPGFPSEWKNAAFETSDIKYSFEREENKIVYNIENRFPNHPEIIFSLPVTGKELKSVEVNGKTIEWHIDRNSIEFPRLILNIPAEKTSNLEIICSKDTIDNICEAVQIKQGAYLSHIFRQKLIAIFDPQGCLSDSKIESNILTGKVTGEAGYRTLFLQVKEGQMIWWQPFYIDIERQPEEYVVYPVAQTHQQFQVDLTRYFNDSVSNIFSHKYLSPRSPYTTLQIPVQGIGEWCHPATTAIIDDSGLRKTAGKNNETIKTPFNADFKTPEKGKNILFTSLWDNFPDKIDIPLNNNASAAYFMLAGSTNHMQSHIVNGLITATYSDGSSDTLKLINPENWCPIEQDYYFDDLAFKSNAPRPYRIQFKTGLISNNMAKDLQITGVYGRAIEGGAGLILAMPLNKNKKISKISIETVANEVIIGLMSLTLLQ